MDPGTSRALDPGAIAGHLVYVDARDLACLRPYTNVVRDMQSAGALGVLLGNLPEDDVKTLAETAAPFARRTTCTAWRKRTRRSRTTAGRRGQGYVDRRGADRPKRTREGFEIDGA